MLRSVRYGLASICAIGALGALYAPQAAAFGATLTDWRARYGAISSSGDSANCQLCHANSNGGAPRNGYGWNIREAKRDAACDLNGDATAPTPRPSTASSGSTPIATAATTRTCSRSG